MSKARLVPHLLLFATVLALLVLAVAITPPSVSAEAPGEVEVEKCNGLDIAVIIDQSVSMIGENGNDPENFRLDAARTVINQLGQNRLYLCPKAIHRIGVVSFGDLGDPNASAKIDLPFTEIKPDPKAPLSIWQAERANLHDKITAQNLGATDFALAFRTVKAMFDDLAPIGDLERKRAIVLLTDGGPCVEALGCKPQNSTFDQKSYLDAMGQQIEADFPFNERAKTYLWVVAMHNVQGPRYLDTPIANNDSRTLGDYWQALAEAHGGALIRLSQNRNEIPGVFYALLSNVLGTGNAVVSAECGPGYIDPYVETVIFTFFKNDIQFGVSLEHKLKDGTTVRLENGEASGPGVTVVEHSNDDHIERYVIDKPDPGVWTITSTNCGGVRIYRESIVPAIHLTEPTDPVQLYDVAPFYDPAAPRYLSYEIRDRSTGEPFPEDPRYRLTVKVDITSPSGSTTTQVLAPQGEATYRSQEPLPAGEVGVYRLTLTGQTRSADPSQTEPLEVFIEEQSSYSVETTVIPFDFEVVTPQANRVVPLNDLQSTTLLPLEVKLRVFDAEQGSALDLRRVFLDDPAQLFELSLTDPQQQRYQATPVPDTAVPGVLTASFPTVELEGDYTLDVVLKGTYKEDRFRPVKDHVTIPFKRFRSEYFSLAIVAPRPEEARPLNEVGGGTSRPLPITVTVALRDAAGDPLDLATVFQGVAAESILTATLYGPVGSAVASTRLKPDMTAGTGYFAGEFAPQEAEGDYRIEVTLAAQPSSVRYHAQANKQSVRFRGVLTKPYDVRLVTPEQNAVLPVFESGRGCITSAQRFPTVAVELITPGGDLLAPETVFGTQFSQPLTAKLVAPDGATEAIELKAVERVSGTRLEGTAKTIPALSGEYSIEFAAGSASVAQGYAPVERARKVVFRREITSIFNNPGICRRTAGGLGLLAALSLGVLAWNVLTRPVGVVAFKDRRTGLSLHEEMLGSPLRGWFHTYRSTNPGLRPVGLSKMEARRAEPPEGGTRAIRLKLYDEEGELLLDEEALASGDQFDLNRDVVVRYD